MNSKYNLNYNKQNQMGTPFHMEENTGNFYRRESDQRENAFGYRNSQLMGRSNNSQTSRDMEDFAAGARQVNPYQRDNASGYRNMDVAGSSSSNQFNRDSGGFSSGSRQVNEYGNGFWHPFQTSRDNEGFFSGSRQVNECQGDNDSRYRSMQDGGSSNLSQNSRNQRDYASASRHVNEYQRDNVFEHRNMQVGGTSNYRQTSRDQGSRQDNVYQRDNASGNRHTQIAGCSHSTQSSTNKIGYASGSSRESVKHKDNDSKYRNARDAERSYRAESSRETGSGSRQSNVKREKTRYPIPYAPILGQPGAKDDPLTRGLSGAGKKRYLKLLSDGMEPEEARRLARLSIVAREAILSGEDSGMQINIEVKRRRVRRLPFIPVSGQPGAKDDPLRHGLSGAGVRRYMRFLLDGMAPAEARRKATGTKMVSHEATTLKSTDKISSRRRRKEIVISQEGVKKQKVVATKNIAPIKPETITSCNKVAEGVRVAVMAKGYPDKMLTQDVLTKLEDVIIEEVAKGWEHKLLFDGIDFRPGMIIVECRNTETAEWLQKVAPALTHWDGVELETRTENDIPMPSLVSMFLSQSEGQTLSKTLALINAQNVGIQLEESKIYSYIEEGAGHILTMEVDAKSMDAIVKNDYAINYRFGRVHVSCKAPVNDSGSIVKPEQ